ncbi:hypothetical protein D3C87_1505300 [compost metagenome]
MSLFTLRALKSYHFFSYSLTTSLFILQTQSFHRFGYSLEAVENARQFFLYFSGLGVRPVLPLSVFGACVNLQA